MKNGIALVDVNKLKCHEQVVESRVAELEERIKGDSCFKRPIIVAKKSLVILDGHHRFHALKRMGIRKIPCQLVDYQNGEVRVYLRRKELMDQFIKEVVVRMAKAGRLFPPKTTRHLIKKRVGMINFPLKNL